MTAGTIPPGRSHSCPFPLTHFSLAFLSPLLPLPPSHPQHKENLRVTVEGANNGGLLSRLNGLSLFVPASFCLPVSYSAPSLPTNSSLVPMASGNRSQICSRRSISSASGLGVRGV